MKRSLLTQHVNSAVHGSFCWKTRADTTRRFLSRFKLDLMWHEFIGLACHANMAQHHPCVTLLVKSIAFVFGFFQCIALLRKITTLSLCAHQVFLEICYALFHLQIVSIGKYLVFQESKLASMAQFNTNKVLVDHVATLTEEKCRISSSVFIYDNRIKSS